MKPPRPRGVPTDAGGVVIDSLPSAQKMHVKAQDQLAHPRQYGPPEPPTAEQLAAAVATVRSTSRRSPPLERAGRDAET